MTDKIRVNTSCQDAVIRHQQRLKQSKTLRIGILGGSFDPLHNGHIAIAREARDFLNLNRVIFVPAYCPPHKARPILAPFEHRFEMIKRATSETSCFEVSDVERKEVCPSYAGNTIRELKAFYGSENSYYFITGLDSVLTLTNHDKSRIEPGLCYLACLTRPGIDKDTIVSKLPEEYKSYIIFKDSTPVPVSSTVIKERIRQNLGFKDMVPDIVYDYITKYKIYTSCFT